MSAEENKAIALRSWEAVSQGNLYAFDEVYAEDFVGHEPDEDLHGSQAVKEFAATYVGAFPDLVITVEDVIAEGDKVVTRWSASGTHRGELLGIPPTGKQMTIMGITIHRIEGGKIVEEWESPDNLGMMQQLGAIP